MTTEEALEQIARSTAEAVTGLLQTFSPDGVRLTDVSLVPAGGDPLRGMPAPGVAASAAYVDGVTGGNVFTTTLAGAKKLAAAMMGTEAEGTAPLDEIELSAVSEAMNQMMAAGAQATGAVLGQDVDISPPDTRPFESTDGVVEAPGSAAHLTSASFLMFDEPCRLVQIIPTAFTVRMATALDDRALAVEAPARQEGDPAAAAALAALLEAAPVKLTAELGRTHLAVARAVGLPPGAIVELDREPDDPIDLFVNGRRVAIGRLVVTSTGRWAVRVESLLPAASHLTAY